MKAKATYSINHIQEQRERIGSLLRQLRESKGYSQDELSELMGVHRSTLSKIETGKFAITIDYLAKFAWFLGFDVEFVSKS